MADDKTDAAAPGASKAPPAPTPAPVAGEVPVSRGSALARQWMDENLAGGPVARNVEMWNTVHDALPALAVLIDAG